MWLLACSFMVMGLVSTLSLANYSDSESLLVVHALFSQDGCQREGFWEVVGHVVSPFDLAQTLPVGGSLLVPCSLPGPPVIKQLMQMLLWCLARMGGFSQCASSNSVWKHLKKFRQIKKKSYLPTFEGVNGFPLQVPRNRIVINIWQLKEAD